MHLFFFGYCGERRYLHSFPTRRSSDLGDAGIDRAARHQTVEQQLGIDPRDDRLGDRKSTRLNSSHSQNSYAVFCLKKKKDKGCNLIWVDIDVEEDTLDLEDYARAL